MADLKSLMKGGVKKETATTAVVEKKRNQPFTEQQLKDVWQAFADKYKNLQVTYRLLSQGFEYRDGRVIVHIHNPFQETQLNEIRTELLIHLKDHLQNDSIQLVIELKVIEEEDLSHLYMNDKARLNLMIQKNPLVRELKDKFGLDTDS